MALPRAISRHSGVDLVSVVCLSLFSIDSVVFLSALLLGVGLRVWGVDCIYLLCGNRLDFKERIYW
jgi:hypothetical protein